MPFKFKLSKRLALLKGSLLVAGALVALACERTDLSAPEAPSSLDTQLVSPPPGTIVVASAHDGNVPQNTRDKNLATRWSALGDGQWIRYDLGALMTVDRLDIAWFRGNEWASAFDIEMSPDTVTWSRVFTGRSSGLTLQSEPYAFPTASGRYVRIVGHGQWRGTTLLSPWTSITEVSIYWSAGATPPPPPPSAPASVATVTVSPASASVSLAATHQLSAVVKDTNGNVLTGRSFTWASSTPTVATVSATGLVIALAPGSATVTATTEGKSGTAAINVPAPAPSHPGFYVTPMGSPTGDGSVSRPWNLATALAGGGGRVQPGDTIWLRGGTYTGSFTSNLNGTSTRPIVVRQYPGEHVTLVGTGIGSVLYAYGSNTWYWGFELIGGPSSSGGPDNRGANNKFINLVAHDGKDSGIGMLNAGTGGEAYGCISYNNGPADPNNGGGGDQAYSMYIQNTNGTKLIQDNIGFNNYSYNYHVYNLLTNIHLDGNVGFNNGTIAVPRRTGPGIIIAGNNAKGIRVTNNHFYEGATAGMSAWLGAYMRTGQDIVVTGNMFVNYAAIEGPWASAVVTGNTFYVGPIGRSGLVLSTAAAMGNVTWANNTHYGNPSSAGWQASGRSGPSTTFAGWKAASRLGASDINPGPAPTGTQVFVRLNKYEAGRANIIVYNWARQPTVPVDLAQVLAVGDKYEIRNVQNFYGTPVASGTYSGAPVSVPMTPVTAPAPLYGRAYTPAPVTGPTFNVFVITRAAH